MAVKLPKHFKEKLVPKSKGTYLNLKMINWMASFPKSGNTWVRFMYLAHVLKYLDINANSRITYSDAMPHIYQAVSSLSLEHMCMEHRVVLRGAALIHLLAEAAHRPIIVKTHCANIDINSIKLIPYELTKTSVLLVRDPRDVALSYARFLNCDVDKAIELMEDKRHRLCSNVVIPQYVSSWSMHTFSWIKYAKPLVVKYEDLMEDTTHWFKEILKLWSEDTEGAGKAVDMANLANLQLQEKKHGFIENFGHHRFFGPGGSRWKNKLTKDQVDRIEKEHGEMMNELGYM